MTPMPAVILASQSPRRQQLLSWAEVPFEVVVSHTSETIPNGMALDEVPVWLAREKAEVVREKLDARQKNRPIIAADTIVVLDNEILGKPVDIAEAKLFLGRLSGREHRVITGICILHADRDITFSETTYVCFHPLSGEQIDFYARQYQPFDKAGGYAIQEWIGVVGIQSIRGDFYNVMGLPVSRVYQALLSL